MTEKQVLFIPGGEELPDAEEVIEVEVATVEDPEAMNKLLAEAQAIMDENTPKMTVEELEEAAERSRENEAVS